MSVKVYKTFTSILVNLFCFSPSPLHLPPSSSSSSLHLINTTKQFSNIKPIWHYWNRTIESVCARLTAFPKFSIFLRGLLHLYSWAGLLCNVLLFLSGFGVKVLAFWNILELVSVFYILEEFVYNWCYLFLKYLWEYTG